MMHRLALERADVNLQNRLGCVPISNCSRAVPGFEDTDIAHP